MQGGDRVPVLGAGAGCYSVGAGCWVPALVVVVIMGIQKDTQMFPKRMHYTLKCSTYKSRTKVSAQTVRAKLSRTRRCKIRHSATAEFLVDSIRFWFPITSQ